jgi:antagonist of KipI
VIELHFPASKIQFLNNAIICISGAHFVPILNEKSIPFNTPILVAENDVLSMLQPIEGTIAYIGVKGRFNEPNWLNSHSYNSKSIATNDILHFSTPNYDLQKTLQQLIKDFDKSIVEKVQTILFANNEPIRFLPGPEWDNLNENSLQAILNKPFTISVQRNRMGYYLNGPKLETSNTKSYLSSAVTRGTLQLLPNGNIIVLMADHQTIGGYANLGQIILVDLPRFAQMKNDQPFTFSLTNLDTTQSLYRKLYAPFKY